MTASDCEDYINNVKHALMIVIALLQALFLPEAGSVQTNSHMVMRILLLMQKRVSMLCFIDENGR